jgi:hypothetical protein
MSGIFGGLFGSLSLILMRRKNIDGMRNKPTSVSGERTNAH